ncbi:hypothetical protein [Bifidobacterium crudilactis]|uniref:hypothetical protein n=1 Tax=Bifidobacterium crudilactis TaxID=327277 RepID=UPI002649D5CF|nr:hypothetical protein [Bifidobacterium crudilactis]MDN5973531.1 hypothetical protein [Bifidobacterium crudilactis]MDN6459001.1 hypothetical protein [Bifidobacterium crudilactis]MDN6683265.1 hypothetical protein [Bifidobacterium crudilactis]MDN6773426.1 hypothetical protein [Bifidobacterium crudilactis]
MTMKGRPRGVEAWRDGRLVRRFATAAAACEWLETTGQVEHAYITSIRRSQASGATPYGYAWRLLDDAEDLTGRHWHHLTVTRYAGKSRWECVCDCGRTRVMGRAEVLRGHVRTCGTGCVYEYGPSTQPRLYNIWSYLRAWCTDANNPQYRNYGGRGITLRSDWQEDFEPFAVWSQHHGYAPEAFLERIDPKDGFTPDNCRWQMPAPSRQYHSPTLWKPVIRTDRDGHETCYRSITEAAASLIAHGEGHKRGSIPATIGAIDNAILGKSASSYGYTWQFVDQDEES